MPIDLNTDTPTSSVFFSETIELLTSVQLLAVPAHHEFASAWSQKMLQALTNESLDFLRQIGGLQGHGLELIEVVLDSLIFHDLHGLINSIENYSDYQFISILTENLIDETFYQQIVNEKVDLKDVEERIPYLTNEHLLAFYQVLLHTTPFKMSFVQLLTEITNSPLFMKHLQEEASKFENSVINIKNELYHKKPLDVAQELMGKKFGRIYPYQEYLFCPSYFISPHRLRLHHEKMNIVIYDVRKDHIYLNQIGEEISNKLKVIADRTRLEILKRLIIMPTYGKALAKSLDLTTATISHHLEQLKQAGLVYEEKVKNVKYFYAKYDDLNQLFELTKGYLNNKF